MTEAERDAIEELRRCGWTAVKVRSVAEATKDHFGVPALIIGPTHKAVGTVSSGSSGPFAVVSGYHGIEWTHFVMLSEVTPP